eukprot:3940371-Rhodomonas_salina.1
MTVEGKAVPCQCASDADGGHYHSPVVRFCLGSHVPLQQPTLALSQTPCILIGNSPQLGLKLLLLQPNWGLGPLPSQQPLPKTLAVDTETETETEADRDKDRGRHWHRGSDSDSDRGRDVNRSTDSEAATATATEAETVTN